MKKLFVANKEKERDKGGGLIKKKRTATAIN